MDFLAVKPTLAAAERGSTGCEEATATIDAAVAVVVVVLAAAV
jgi:hypothetical protein